MAFKSEQQIYADLKTIIDTFCANYETSEGQTWANNVLQWGQPTLQELPSPCILMDIPTSQKYGWVSTKYKYDKGTQSGGAEMLQYRLVDIVLSFYRSEADLLNADLSTYISADDMANMLRMYILSDEGVETMKALGFGLRDTSVMRNPPLVLDGETYARVPNFTLTIAVRETNSTPADFVDWEQQISNNDTTKNSETKIIGV